MADSTNPLETCARLVTYRGFGGDAEAAEAERKAAVLAARAKAKARPSANDRAAEAAEREFARVADVLATRKEERKEEF